MHYLLSFVPVLAQQGNNGGQPGGGGGLVGIGYMVLLVGIMYFLLLRPQQQKAKQHRELVSRLKSGDQVVTNGGIHGEVTGVDEANVRLKVAENVELKVVRSAIGSVLNDDVDEPRTEKKTRKAKS